MYKTIIKDSVLFIGFCFLFISLISDVKADIVIKVYDGDTITYLDKDNNKQKGRLQYIDAPELYQTYGTESRDFLKSLILNKDVKIVTSSKDQYNRNLIELFIDGQSINLYMVKAGYAWSYRRYNHNDANYNYWESQAKQNKLGLWAINNPQNPEKYRQNIKKQMSQSINQQLSPYCQISSHMTCSQILTCDEAMRLLTECELPTA